MILTDDDIYPLWYKYHGNVKKEENSDDDDDTDDEFTDLKDIFYLDYLKI